MIQRRQGLGFAREAGQALGVLREQLRQDLDGHIAVQAAVAGAIHLAHAARAQRADDFVGAELCSG